MTCPALSCKGKIYLALVSLCFLVYANSLFGSFVYDYILVILKTPAITKPLNFLFEPADLFTAFFTLLTYILYNKATADYGGNNQSRRTIDIRLYLICLFILYLAPTNNLGSAYQRLGRPREAIAAYLKILEIDPGFIKAYNIWR